MVENGDLRVAGENEVAVHAVDEEDGVVVGGRGRGDGPLGCGEGLRDGGAAVDAAGAGGVP